MAINWNPSSPSPAVDRLVRLPQVRAGKAGGRPPSSFDLIAERARAEYREMPGLNLTRDQACCLWGLDHELCDQLLTHLVDTGFLIRTWHNSYVRADGG